MAETRDRDEFHRTGGQPDQPHGKEGPPTDANEDATRIEKPGKVREAEQTSNPTHPVKGNETPGSGSP